jgi:hypothetical protein
MNDDGRTGTREINRWIRNAIKKGPATICDLDGAGGVAFA